MTLSDAVITTKQYQTWLRSLGALDSLKQGVVDSLLKYDGWTHEKLVAAFATIGDVLVHAEAAQTDEKKRAELVELRNSVTKLGAEVRQLRDTKAKVEAEVMSLHEQANRQRATIDEQRGDLLRLQAGHDDVMSKIQSIGQALNAVDTTLSPSA
jgi:uncharacterized coiled-coil DUF342 family protein